MDFDSKVKVVGKRSNSSKPERTAGENWLAIGDAALAFDPLSSHGISNALYTAMKAATSIEHYLESGNRQTIKEELLQPVTSHGNEALAIKQKSNDELRINLFATYNSTLSEIFNAYLKSKNALYQRESRWEYESYWANLS